MTQNMKPIVIDESTGEVFTQLKSSITRQTPTIPAAFNKGKQGQQLTTLLDAFYNPFKYNISIFLGENKFGTKYCFIGGKFLLVESDEFRDQIVHLAITHLGFVELSNAAVKNLIQVLLIDDSIWTKDHQGCNTPSVRIINQGYPNIFYIYRPGNPIPLVDPNLYQPLCYQGVTIPKQAEWPSIGYHWNMFSHATLSAMSTAPRSYIPNLFELIDQLQIPSKLQYIFMSILIHNLIADEYLLFEITSDIDAHSLLVYKHVKDLIDPVIDYAKPLPKKAYDIKRYALEEFLPSFETVSDKSMSPIQQETILELLKGSATIEAIPKSKNTTKCQLKRPVLLKAPDTVVNLPALREKTISVNLAKPDDFNLRAIDQTLTENARLELIRLSQLVAYVNYAEFHSNQMPFSVELKEFHSLNGVINIGCELSRLFTSTTDQFVEEFKEWAIEDLFMQLDNNDGAYLVYLWAKDHTNSKAQQPLKDWLNELTFYAKSEGIDIENIAPRKLGA
ncbi:MAG: hypothetical protein U9N57_04805, partial [Pseudomonadota bacterium]|nr:hypothetical protein [Pseudomonadota bacterium]